MSYDNGNDNSNHNGNDASHNGNYSINEGNNLLAQQENVVNALSITSEDMAYISSLYDKENVEFNASHDSNQGCLDAVYRIYLALRYKSYGQWYYYQSLCFHLQNSNVTINTAQLASSPIYAGIKNATNKTCRTVVDFYNNKMNNKDTFTKYVIGLMRTFDNAAMYKAQGIKKGDGNKRKNRINGNLVPSKHSSKMFSKGKKRKAEKSKNDEPKPKKPKIVGETYMNVVKCCCIVLCNLLLWDLYCQ